ncbi:MAG: PAS domain-containing protein [Polyangiaceae bacterium]|nr:PAS domain-containing protein [Polyangiaceae bacterium]
MSGDELKGFTTAEIEHALRASGVAIWVWDPKSDVVRWSDTASHILPILRGNNSATLQDFVQLIHPDDRERLSAVIAASLRGASSEPAIQYRVLHGDDRDHWVEGRGAVVLNKRGEVDCMLGAVRDVTAQKTFEQALQQSEERLRLYSELASDYVYQADLVSLVPTILAGSLEQATSYSPQDVAARGGWLNVIHPDDIPDATELAKALNAGKPFMTEYRVIDRDGQVRWLKDRALPLMDATGKPTGVIGGVQEVTELKSLESQLVHSQKMEALARLAGAVAHDFNNLLTVMWGAADHWGAERDADATEAKADLESALKRATELTRALLAFGRKQVGVSQTIDIDALITSVRTLLQRAVGERVQLDTDLSSDGATLMGDPGQFQLMLLNLAVNARDAMPDGGRLRITTRRGVPPKVVASPDSESVLVQLADTGVGITGEVLPHIFEPFYTTKREGRGTGLGLATVHGIITQLEGSILVDTYPGVGTRFDIWLPIASASVPVAAPASVRQRIGGLENVLVVEDDPLVRRTTVRALKALGYHVQSAESSERALELPDLDAVALLVSDVRLPGMSGHVLASELKKRFPELQVLLVSGYAEAVPEYADAEQFPFLRKPFAPGVLAERVRNLLDRRDR